MADQPSPPPGPDTPPPSPPSPSGPPSGGSGAPPSPGPPRPSGPARPSIGSFKGRWTFPITQTATQTFQVMNENISFKKVTDEFYFRIARLYRWWRPIENLARIYLHFWLREQERKVLDHPIGKKLFEVWLGNIYGRRSGIYIDRDAQVEFLDDLFQLLDIQHHPKHQEVFNHYQDLFIGIRLMRQVMKRALLRVGISSSSRPTLYRKVSK